MKVIAAAVRIVVADSTTGFMIIRSHHQQQLRFAMGVVD